MGRVSQSGNSVRHRSPAATGNTKSAILDSAENLICRSDTGDVTLRQIADAAGVDPASITYHFGGRAELMRAIVQRRYLWLRELRMGALTYLLATSDRIPTSRQVLDTVYRPLFDVLKTGDPGWRAYARLVASMPDALIRDDLAGDLAGHWEATLQAALNRPRPEVSASRVSLAFKMTLGVAIIATATQWVGPGNQTSDQIETMAADYPTFLDFVVGGFEALVSSPER